jgi:RNA polymerase sigma-70 factor (ECF subfamily)
VDDLTRLARTAADGDRVALAAFVRGTQADVWRLCAHLVGRDRADDVTQDVYVRAIGSLPSFRGDASARTWLLGIARRTVVDTYRGAVRRRRLHARLSPRPAAPDPSGAVALDRLVTGLDDDRRLAFVLTQVLGLTYAETAAVCDCGIGTIRSRVARARHALVDALDDALDEAVG